MQRLGVTTVAAATLAFACGERPSKVDGAPSVPPNETYQLESGKEEGFIWRCVNAERIRMYRSVDGKSVGKWQIVRAACGEHTPEEPPPIKRRPMSGAGWW